MLRTPKSLTATIHVQFNYDGEKEPKQATEGEVELVNKILDRTSELEPDLQNTILKFVDYLNKLGGKGDGQSTD
ncbi:hypothetical protein ES703_87699 [subsurface metagenome]